MWPARRLSAALLRSSSDCPKTSTAIGGPDEPIARASADEPTSLLEVVAGTDEPCFVHGGDEGDVHRGPAPQTAMGAATLVFPSCQAGVTPMPEDCENLLRWWKQVTARPTARA